MASTTQKCIDVAGIKVSNDHAFTLFAGMNVIEDEALLVDVASTLKEICEKLSIPLVFKASFDKANRSSVTSFRGPGMDKGLKALKAVKEKLGLPLITDVHEPHQAAPVAEVCDVIQIPAFLCRQTDLVRAMAETGAVINIKKMQMMAPWDVENIYKKFLECGNDKLMICERGTQFGYNNLVVDPLAFPKLKEYGYPVVFDVTHSLQMPGGLGHATAGRGQYAEVLGAAGMSTGIAGLFMETHPDPTVAKCDGPCATKLSDMEAFLKKMKAFDELSKA
jgi:2-dehydro-3-deoxyphosphooctonate aldolase (KDO 8-P synthase)